jgi:hypothetical protein
MRTKRNNIIIIIYIKTLTSDEKKTGHVKGIESSGGFYVDRNSNHFVESGAIERCLVNYITTTCT